MFMVACLLSLVLPSCFLHTLPTQFRPHPIWLFAHCLGCAGQLAILLLKVEAASGNPAEALPLVKQLIQAGLQYATLVVGCILAEPIMVWSTQGHECTQETTPPEKFDEV